MNQSPTSWTETDSETYRDLARYAVPERERQIAVIVRLVQVAKADGDVLDLCCGEGFLSAAIQTALPNVGLLAYDGSESMLAATATRVPDPSKLTTKRIDLASRDWRRLERPLRAAVSSLAVHHLEADEKRKLFADLYAALSVSGVFVLADLMQPATEAARLISAEMWDEETKRRSLDLSGDLRGFELFQSADWNFFRETVPNGVDKPSAIVRHLDWLREAGFADVDVHWMVAGHAIISGWRF